MDNLIPGNDYTITVQAVTSSGISSDAITQTFETGIILLFRNNFLNPTAFTHSIHHTILRQNYIKNGFKINASASFHQRNY